MFSSPEEKGYDVVAEISPLFAVSRMRKHFHFSCLVVGLCELLTDNNKSTKLLLTSRDPRPELLVNFRSLILNLYMSICVRVAFSSRLKPEFSMGIPLRVLLWAEKFQTGLRINLVSSWASL